MSGGGASGRGRLRVTRNRVRLLAVVLILISAGVLAAGATGGFSTATEADVPRAPPADGHTVITESGRTGTITAYDPDGEVLYYNNSRTKYFDVDPVEDEPMTVEYAAVDTINDEGPTCSDPPCIYNVIERANLTTGAVEVVYARYDRDEWAGEWHDHDRVNETHILVADILDDQVFLVDTETEIIEWLWDAQIDFPIEGGGPYPTDWAHINDVEYIEEGENAGRIMVSLRNQDQVVFVDPETGVVDEWTLGSEDDYDVMFEQHNPDYIPESRGGPAIVLADSEHGRVQEFQREGDEWVRSWEWSDDRMRWPRDADRLPNGNTLVTDTHGNRVMEVSPAGEVVWEVPSTLPYEAERLESGEESAGGESAARLGLESRTAEAATGREPDGPLTVLAQVVTGLMPHRVHNAVLFASPVWMGRPEFLAASVGALAAIGWAGCEVAWRLRDAGIGIRSPVFRRE